MSYNICFSYPYCNAGFIEAWNPFGSGKYFDTPPSCPDPKMGYSLKPGISVARLSVEDSQLMMSLFDSIPKESGLGEQDYHVPAAARRSAPYLERQG